MPRATGAAAQVHGFRMALWEEHTGIIHPSFYDPANMDCVLQMRSIGQTNWEVCLLCLQCVCHALATASVRLLRGEVRVAEPNSVARQRDSQCSALLEMDAQEFTDACAVKPFVITMPHSCLPRSRLEGRP